jgi:hypothetical protein
MKSDAEEVDSNLSGARRFRPPAGSADDIRDLLSKIEQKLPNVAEATHDLRALRNLLHSQLLNATNLQATNYPPHSLSGKIFVGPPA